MTHVPNGDDLQKLLQRFPASEVLNGGVEKITKDLGQTALDKLFSEMTPTTLHQTSLRDGLAKLGTDRFAQLVKQDGVEAMVKYGPEALDKAGLAELQKASGITATNITPLSLQKKWKHAVDFGVASSWKATDVAAHKQFIAALNEVVAKADAVFIGPYHNEKFAAHFFKGGQLVIVKLDGEFLSGWSNVASKLAGIKNAAPPNGFKNFRVK